MAAHCQSTLGLKWKVDEAGNETICTEKQLLRQPHCVPFFLCIIYATLISSPFFHLLFLISCNPFFLVLPSSVREHVVESLHLKKKKKQKTE